LGTILVEQDGRERAVEFNGRRIRVDKLLLQMGIYPETAVVVRNGELLCDDELLTDGDKVEVVVATSRG